MILQLVNLLAHLSLNQRGGGKIAVEMDSSPKKKKRVDPPKVGSVLSNYVMCSGGLHNTFYNMFTIGAREGKNSSQNELIPEKEILQRLAP